MIMAACPIISTTRLGATVAVGLLVAAPLCLLAMQWLDGKRKNNRGQGQGAALLY